MFTCDCKKIQPEYLISPYFKDLFLYLAQNKLPNTKSTIRKMEMLAESYILLDLLLFKLVTMQETETVVTGYTRNMCQQDNYFISFKPVCGTSSCNKDISN